MISGLKILSQKLDIDQLTKVVTAQYFGVINYAIPVWYDALTWKDKQKMDVLHYKATRVIIKDWEIIYPREILDLIGREKPHIFAEYAKASLVIKVLKSGKPTRLHGFLQENRYQTRRKPDQSRFYNSARKKIGGQSIKNRLDNTFAKLDGNWKTLDSDDSIRRYLKKLFFHKQN